VSNENVILFIRLLESSDCLNLAVAHLEYIAASRPKSLLSEYIFSSEALDIVDKHLPILVELYEFIHRELSYRLTKDLAKKLTIQGMLKRIDKLQSHFSQEDIKHLNQMISHYFGKICPQNRAIQVQ
jgi:hypothetical protein